MGCVAQAEGEEIVNRNNFVDYVVGPQNIQAIPNLLKEKEYEKVHIDFLSEEKFESLKPSQSNKISRLITIQEGCDKFCSFCVVPYTGAQNFQDPWKIFMPKLMMLSKRVHGSYTFGTKCKFI